MGSDGGRRLAVPALLGTVLIWSSTFVVTRVFLEEADHFAVTAGRFLIVAAGIYINRIPVVGLIFALALGETTMGGIIAVSGVLLSEAAVREPPRSTDDLESLRLDAEGHRQAPPDLTV